MSLLPFERNAGGSNCLVVPLQFDRARHLISIDLQHDGHNRVPSRNLEPQCVALDGCVLDSMSVVNLKT